MPAPVHRLRKDEIVMLAKKHCKRHGHTYLEHYECYLKEVPQAEPERLGFFDIEASNLDADYGQCLCWCIKEGGSDKIHEARLSLADVEAGIEDKRIIQECVDTFGKFDRIVTYYGTGFDLPFVRARALITGVPFPAYGSLKHRDLYYLIRNKFKLSSRRLENACRQLLGSTEKTRIDAKYWRQAVRGEKKSIDYIIDHCRKDVLDLERLYVKTEQFQKMNATMI